MEKNLTQIVIGILGTGQLGRMIIQSASNFGIKTHVYGPEEGACGFELATYKTCAEYLDFEALQKFIDACDVITIEIESIPLEALALVEESGKLKPGYNAIKICADRFLEKEIAEESGFKTVPYCRIDDTYRDVPFDFPFPALLKTRHGGYDGGKQIICNTHEDVFMAWAGKDINYAPCILEQKIGLDFEFSLIVGRSAHGQTFFPLVKNQHEDGMLVETLYDSAWNKLFQKKEEMIHLLAEKLLQKMNFIGLLAIEMFMGIDGKFYFNEMAPRPHNSGHWTIEGCSASQFEVLIRAIIGRPMVTTRPVCKSATMTNILRKYSAEALQEWMSYGHLHLYGKEAKETGRRKIGHWTVI